MAAKLTEDLLTAVCSKVRAGVPFKAALASEGITNDMTPWRWKQRAAERPGSIYGRWQQAVERAQAEATVADVVILRNASTRVSTTVTRKLEAVVDIEGRPIFDTVEGVRTQRMIEVERTEVQRPPDPRWAAWLLERRDPAFRPHAQADVTVAAIPKEVMARQLGEKLRMVQGGDPNVGSLLAPDDASFQRLMGAAP